MAKLDRKEFFEHLGNVLGERNDDEALAFLEDARETFDDFEQSSGAEWKQKYEDNDKSWRERYRKAFYSPVVERDDPETTDPETISIDDLFKN